VAVSESGSIAANTDGQPSARRAIGSLFQSLSEGN
jgi:hypothetical protein